MSRVTELREIAREAQTALAAASAMAARADEDLHFAVAEEKRDEWRRKAEIEEIEAQEAERRARETGEPKDQRIAWWARERVRFAFSMSTRADPGPR